MINTSNKLGIENNFLNMIKSIYEKYTANITLNSGKTESFFHEIRNKIRMSTFASSMQNSIDSSSPKFDEIYKSTTPRSLMTFKEDELKKTL